ncbi:phosphoenolpyruvate--protein phosphotransferase [Neisseria perflava]|uniref:phosphoenolpyruvate--protein phosphotransferase n=1 Tax=Neisseria perflava TaxID=33053 RepID=UPI0020A13629|nr:phosphoenolpyruvate--protein phosphotransferase [Neisseria perflava]MCP1659231.1 phosphocarrier protein FPr [Neisseria perflava]MCP1771727.1 phosphocarrier protein FPr [Neisseria perflava]
MLTLLPEHIRMNRRAADKEEALQIIADTLSSDGLTLPEYLGGLKAREAQTSTYLGQGIAIPHGTPESRSSILTTGVRLVHFPEGVVWDGVNKIYLAVAIAAKSDEHLQILQLLTRALSEDIADKLSAAQTPQEILSLLNAEQETLTLHENLIAADTEAADADDVLYQAANLLKKQKMVEAGFISSLNPADAVNVQGEIWCVTGEKHVLQPAVAIVKPKQAVPFNGGKLTVLVCIAANDKLDMTQLSKLMGILFGQSELQNSHTRRDIALAVGAETVPDWQSVSVVLPNPLGLHARPATALANLCQEFPGEVRVSVDGGAYVSAKSLTKLLSLGAVRGQTLTFIIEPVGDTDAALAQIVQAVKSGLGDEVEALEENDGSNADTAALFVEPVKLQDDVRNQGVAASAGLAFGKIHLVAEQHFTYERVARDAAAERIKLQDAIAQVKADLGKTIQDTEVKAVRQIFKAHAALLDDPELLQQVNDGLQENLTAAAAWHSRIEALAKEQESLNNALLAERAADLRDVGNKVMAVLCGVQTASEPDEPYILVMEDVVPSVVARLDKNRVAGILTAAGGASSHSAIVARALGMPAVVGAGEAVLALPSEKTTLLLNGEDGAFFVNPAPARVEEAMRQRDIMQQQRAAAEAHCMEAAVTSDGHRVEVAVNLGKVQDAAAAVTRGAEAVGLLRTELVFMAHANAPDEAKQEKDYRVVFDAMDGKPIVVRTLDVGGDKPLPYLPMPKEANPFLGERGIRLTLRRPQLLRMQLAALFKAADGRPLRVMFPMIGRLEEWHAAKAILDDVRAQVPCDNLQVGIMIEVPSAALIAEHLAKEVDFFSVGTNDLTQYTLAIDRGHPALSAEADGLHPSVLALIDRTVKAAHAHGKWVGVCGELAADSKAVPVLLGLGVDELSVSAASIPLVKAKVRTLNLIECRQMAQQALTCATAAEVRSLSSRNG